MVDHNALHIYTDGSSFPSPRRGGIGIKFVFPDFMKREELIFNFDGFIGATNNQMELKACIVALGEVLNLDGLQQVSRIIIRTDSLYVKDNVNFAKYVWSKNKWKTKSGAPVLNVPLWKELVKNIQAIPKRIDFEWVKGHAKNEHNNEVNILARASARKPTQKLSNIVHVRRKLSEKKVELGSVKMLGQKFAIKIITCEYLRAPHKIFKYKYEVVSKKSKFYKNVDIIYYHEALRQRHTYFVSLNKDNGFPQISKILKILE